MNRRRRSVIAVFAVGIIGALAIGASSASAQEGTVPFRAFMPSGTDATLVGVPNSGGFSGAVGASCSTGDDISLAIQSGSPGNIVKTLFFDEGTGSNVDNFAFQDDNFNTSEQAPMNDFGAVGNEVSGTLEFSNRSTTRQLTAQYATEDGSDFQAGGPDADCAVWGSAVKVFGPGV
jgi:hypothetical protein